MLQTKTPATRPGFSFACNEALALRARVWLLAALILLPALARLLLLLARLLLTAALLARLITLLVLLAALFRVILVLIGHVMAPWFVGPR